jgi:hypothetical protein
MPLEVTIGALPRERFGATLKFIVPKASKGQDGVTHVEIRAALARKPGRFVRAGYSAMAAVVVDRREDMLAVRKRYLKLRGGEPYVQVEMRPRVFKRRVLALGLVEARGDQSASGLCARSRALPPSSKMFDGANLSTIHARLDPTNANRASVSSARRAPLAAQDKLGQCRRALP